ncbi:MAG: nuclear transport factor 2 family protein [Cyclobacteriaceae bacterium]|nr:nuclear transport factor 2 family protein [Cyclobacteriaceae bacterium]
MKRVLLFVGVCILSISCDKGSSEERIKKWKNEILEAEKNFSDMAREKGISKAFLYYAAEDAVLNRNDSLIIGKESIRAIYTIDDVKSENTSLTWSPDFVDVASSGDMGYTYGKYQYTRKDSLGNPTAIEGVFHTVWKRQHDGKWKFVWD